MEKFGGNSKSWTWSLLYHPVILDLGTCVSVPIAAFCHNSQSGNRSQVRQMDKQNGTFVLTNMFSVKQKT